MNLEENLPQIEAEIVELHSQIQTTLRTTVDKARRIGELLIQVKASLPHGQYLRWVKDKLKIARQTAQTYTQVAKAENQIDQPAGHITLDGTLKRMRLGRRIDRQEEARALASAAVPYTEGSGIVTGDSLEWLRARPDASVAAFVTDAPYGLGIEYDGWKEATNAEDHWNWLKPYWDEMKRIVQPGGVIVIWQGYAYLRHLQDWFDGCMIVANCFRARKLHQWEPICKWTKPGGKAHRKMGAVNDWILSDMFDLSSSRNYRTVHPCPKGLKHCQQIIDRYTIKGSLVVDPFCGTGTIPLACKLEGRGFIGLERSEKFAAMARRRVETESGSSVALKKAA